MKRLSSDPLHLPRTPDQSCLCYEDNISEKLLCCQRVTQMTHSYSFLMCLVILKHISERACNSAKSLRMDRAMWDVSMLG